MSVRLQTQPTKTKLRVTADVAAFIRRVQGLRPGSYVVVVEVAEDGKRLWRCAELGQEENG